MRKVLRTLFLVDLIKGMWVTMKYTPQPAFTFQYPAERRPMAPRFRGVLRLQIEPETGAQTCIVCDQCAKACPDDLIALGGHREPGQKIKILDYFDFNLSRCSFCGLCSEVCPTKPIKALIMSEDYELGTYSRETQILRIDEMYDGVPISNTRAKDPPFFFHLRRGAPRSYNPHRTATRRRSAWCPSSGCCRLLHRDLIAVIDVSWRLSPQPSLQMPRRCGFNWPGCCSRTGAISKRSRRLKRPRSTDDARILACQALSGGVQAALCAWATSPTHMPTPSCSSRSCSSRDPEAVAFCMPTRCGPSGLFEDAERRFNDSLSLDKENARAMHGLARSLAARNRLSDVLETAQAALNKDPRDAEFHHTVGSVDRAPEPLRGSRDCLLELHQPSAEQRPQREGCLGASRSAVPPLIWCTTAARKDGSGGRRHKAAHGALPPDRREDHGQGTRQPQPADGLRAATPVLSRR